jgi:hypothetical protein
LIKSGRIRWAGLVAHTGEMRGAYRFFVGSSSGRDHLEDPDVYGRIMLRWTFKKADGGMDWIVLAENRDRWRVL